MSASPIRVLLLAPAHEILGGQTVQAFRLLDILGSIPEGAVPGIEMRFFATNPLFPSWLRWVKRIPVGRTVLSMILYLPTLLWNAARCDILHVFTAGLWAYTMWTIPAIAVGKLLRKRVIVNYRDGQCEQHLRSFPTAKPTLLWADAIVTPSGFLVDVFARYGIKAQSISNVIDGTGFIYRRRSKIRPLLMTNRGLEPLYNVECVLRAFGRILEKYPDARLTVAHDGSRRAFLEEYAAKLGLRNCEFIGKVPRERAPRLYDASDIYLMTPNIDNMPGSLLECMASGIPIVSTNAGGIPYMVADGETALLVDVNDDAGVAACVFRLLEDPALVEGITDRAAAEIQRYSPDAVRDQWVELYRQLVTRG